MLTVRLVSSSRMVFGVGCVGVKQIVDSEVSSHSSFVTGIVQSKCNEVTWHHV